MNPFEQIKQKFPQSKEIRICFEYPRERESKCIFQVQITKNSTDEFIADVKNMDNEGEVSVSCRGEETWENLLHEIYIHTQL
jgi:hypothetical protein